MIGLIVFCLLAIAAWLLLGNLPGPTNRPMAEGRKPAEPDGRSVGIEDPALMLDLAAAMLEAGQPMSTVLEVLSHSCQLEVGASIQRAASALNLGASWDSAWQLAAGKAGDGSRLPVIELASALAFAGSTGAPSAKLLYAHASQSRRRINRAAEKRAASLGVKLVVPLGACALPAFVCLGVMPVLFALVPSLG